MGPSLAREVSQTVAGATYPNIAGLLRTALSSVVPLVPWLEGYQPSPPYVPILAPICQKSRTDKREVQLLLLGYVVTEKKDTDCGDAYPMRCQVEPGAASAGDPYPKCSRSSGYIVTAEKDTDWCEKGYRIAVVGQSTLELGLESRGPCLFT